MRSDKAIGKIIKFNDQVDRNSAMRRRVQVLDLLPGHLPPHNTSLSIFDLTHQLE
jgi:hypothetical protein